MEMGLKSSQGKSNDFKGRKNEFRANLPYSAFEASWGHWRSRKSHPASLRTRISLYTGYSLIGSGFAKLSLFRFLTISTR